MGGHLTREDLKEFVDERAAKTQPAPAREPSEAMRRAEREGATREPWQPGGEREELPADRAEAFARGLEQFQRLAADRDRLAGEVERATQETQSMAARIDSLLTECRIMEDRMKSAVVERDRAVEDRAVYETLFASFRAQLAEFEPPRLFDGMLEVRKLKIAGD